MTFRRDNIGANLILDNLISDNGDGIRLVGATSNTNVIQGNMIGTDLGGILDFGNSDDGISVEGGSGNRQRDMRFYRHKTGCTCLWW